MKRRPLRQTSTASVHTSQLVNEIEDVPGEETNKSNKSPKQSWCPTKWRTQFANIKKMRASFDAPVDSMGCERLAESDEPKTKDAVTAAAMTRLKANGLGSLENLLTASTSSLQELIYPVGFYKSKAVYILKTCEILRDQFNGDIPNTVADLCKLPGVGPKMAYLTMKCAWNQIEGIGVDTHVHRISNRLKWVKAPTKHPEKTRIELEKWLPRYVLTKICLYPV